MLEFEFLDGKEYTYKGIHGYFRCEFWKGQSRLYHIPSEQGQETEEYRKVRQYLGDDWTTDLTYNDEVTTDIALELGYEFSPEDIGYYPTFRIISTSPKY